MQDKTPFLLRWVEVQLEACRPLALRYFRKPSLRIQRKADDSPVTIADRLIEERLRRAIERDFPGETIVGEEFGSSGRMGDTYWTIDPIDGTRGFSRGLPSWGMLIGRVEKGKVSCGVCDFPAIDTRIAAMDGSSYERVGRQRRSFKTVSRMVRLKDAVIFHGGSCWWQETPFAKGFARLVKHCYLERAYGDCFGYLWALRGCVDAVIEYGVKPWDLVPFAAFAQATGRVLTDFYGKASISGPEVIFAHPRLARLISKQLVGNYRHTESG